MEHNNDQFPMDANFGHFYNSGRMPRAAVGLEPGGPPRFERAPAPPHQLWGLNGASHGGGGINPFQLQQPLYFPPFGTGGGGGGVGFPPPAPPPTPYMSDMDLWWYIHPFGGVKGPVHTDQMGLWYMLGLLPCNTPVRRNCDQVFMPLLDLSLMYRRNPFFNVIGSPSPPPPFLAMQTPLETEAFAALHIARAAWAHDLVRQSNQFQEAEERVGYGQSGDSGLEQDHRSSASHAGDTSEYDQRQKMKVKVEAHSPKLGDVSSSVENSPRKAFGFPVNVKVKTEKGSPLESLATKETGGEFSGNVSKNSSLLTCGSNTLSGGGEGEVSNSKIIDTYDGCCGSSDTDFSTSYVVNPAWSGAASGMHMRSQVGSNSIKEEVCHSEKSTASDEPMAKTSQSEKRGKEGTKIPKIDSGVRGGAKRSSRVSTLRSRPGKKVKKEKRAQPPKVFKCDLCDKIYMSRTGVYVHKKNKHSDAVENNKNGNVDDGKISESASTALLSDPDPDNYMWPLFENPALMGLDSQGSASQIEKESSSPGQT